MFSLIMDDQSYTEMESAPLRAVCALMSTVTTEMTILQSESKWKVSATDNSHTVMCTCTIDSPLPVGDAEGWCVRLQDIQRALSADRIGIAAEDGYLRIRAGRMTSRMRLLTPEAPPKVPKLSLDSYAVVLASDLRELVTTADRRVDRVAFVLDGDGLTVNALDDDMAGRTLHVPPEELLDSLGSAAVVLSVRNTEPFVKALPKDAEVRLEMADDYPVRAVVQGDGWTCEWLCAPIIESE